MTNRWVVKRHFHVVHNESWKTLANVTLRTMLETAMPFGARRRPTMSIAIWRLLPLCVFGPYCPAPMLTRLCVSGSRTHYLLQFNAVVASGLIDRWYYASKSQPGYTITSSLRTERYICYEKNALKLLIKMAQYAILVQNIATMLSSV